MIPITLTRLDDYQSWLLDTGGARLLIDPWLDDEPIEGGGFERRHAVAPARLDTLGAIDGVILCAAVNDHLRPATLAALPAGTPVLVAEHAIRLARRSAPSVEFTPVAVHDTASLPGDVSVTCVATGRPLGLVASGWVVDMGRLRLWLDPHQPDVVAARRIVRRIGPVDAMFASTERVCFGDLQVTSGPRKVATAADAVGAATVVCTAVDPMRDLTPQDAARYRVTGGPARLAQHFGGNVITVDQGETIEL